MPLKRALYELARSSARTKKREQRKGRKGPSAKKLAEQAERKYEREVKQTLELASDITPLLPIPPAIKGPLKAGFEIGAEPVSELAGEIVSPLFETVATEFRGPGIKEQIPTFNVATTPAIFQQPQFQTRSIDAQQPEVNQMTPLQIIEEVINNPAIQLTEDMLPAINDPGVFMRNGQMMGQFTRANLLRTKKKRKVSKYQKEFGKQLKLLKKKHPRIPITRLMKRAHAATRKALKK